MAGFLRGCHILLYSLYSDGSGSKSGQFLTFSTCLFSLAQYMVVEWETACLQRLQLVGTVRGINWRVLCC